MTRYRCPLCNEPGHSSITCPSVNYHPCPGCGLNVYDDDLNAIRWRRRLWHGPCWAIAHPRPDAATAPQSGRGSR